MTDPRTFIGQCLTGNASALDIDDWIDMWHESAGDIPIFHWLGLSEEEYANFVLAPQTLPHIITIRRLVENGRIILQQAAINMGANTN